MTVSEIMELRRRIRNQDDEAREKIRQERDQYADACANESENEQVRRDSAAPERTP